MATLVAAFVASAAVAPSAKACDTSYWTVGCHYYPSQTGDTKTQLGFSTFNTTYATFSPFDTTRQIWTTAGGSWVGAQTTPYGGFVHWQTKRSDDKLGCFNHHTATQWVNCREYQGWGET